MATVYQFPYRTVAEVSLSRLVRNLVTLRSRSGLEVIPVVKADAYGHGLFPVARALVSRGCSECLAVATLEEALELRRNLPNVSLLVLSGFFPHQLDAYCNHRIMPMIHSLAHLKAVSERVSVPPIHLELDTGMNRLGIKERELSEAMLWLERLPNKIAGLATHFAESEASGSFTEDQLRVFESMYRELLSRRLIATDTRIHVANSGAVLQRRLGPSTAVRAGLALYGISPNPALSGTDELLPVLEWKTRVLSLKEVWSGETVGYSRRYRAERTEQLAILPVGYADGYPRCLSQLGQVLIGGKRCPVRGLISMDLISVDVTQVPNAREGSVVTLIGRSEQDEITAWDLAREAKTIPYEILCGISSRVTRLYFE